MQIHASELCHIIIAHTLEDAVELQLVVNVLEPSQHLFAHLAAQLELTFSLMAVFVGTLTLAMFVR